MALSAFNGNRYDDALNAGLQAVKMQPDPDIWRMISVICASRQDSENANFALDQAKKAEAEQRKMSSAAPITASSPPHTGSDAATDLLPGASVTRVNGADCHIIQYKAGWKEGDLINTRTGPGQNYSVANKIAVGEKGLVMEFWTTSNIGTRWVRVFRWDNDKKDSATFIGWANKTFLQFDDVKAEQGAKEQTESEKTTKKELKPNATPADTATIKNWVNKALKRGEEWGNGDSKH